MPRISANSEESTDLRAAALILSSFLVIASGAAPAAQTMTIYSPLLPGMAETRNGGKTAEGLFAENLTEIATLAGLSAEIKSVPMTRAITMTKTQADTCVAGIVRRPENEADFKWTDVLAAQTWFIYGRPDDTKKYPNLSDFNYATVGAVLGLYMNAELSAFNSTINIDYSPEGATNIKKLLAGRFDFIFSSNAQVATITKLLGMPKLREIRQIAVSQHRIACNTSVDDAIIARLNAAIDTEKKEGHLDYLNQ